MDNLIAPVIDQARIQASENSAQQRLKGVENAPTSRDEIRDKAEEFESIFISQMLKHMFDGVKPDPLFGGGQTEEIYRDMLLDEYGKIMSKSGGIGVADAVQNKLLQVQSEQVK